MSVNSHHLQLEADALDTVKACLVACGGSVDPKLLEEQCKAAGTKPSEFIRQTGGRLMQLIHDWDTKGRNGHCLPVIPVELIWDIERILLGDDKIKFFPLLEDGYTQENHEPASL